jgi:hypothetical protein
MVITFSSALCNTIYAVGHGIKTLTELIGLPHAKTRRRSSTYTFILYSRRYPQFNRERVQVGREQAGIDGRWMNHRFGGRAFLPNFM